MAITSMHLDIVSAEKVLYSGEASMIYAITELGEVGIAPGHTQLLAALKPGDIRTTLQNGEERIFYVSGGFLEVQPQTVTVLSDTVIRVEDLDEEAILSAKQAAEAILQGQPEELEYAKAMTELAETAAQLQALAKLRKRRG